MTTSDQNPLTQVYPWEWGPDGGIGVIQVNREYWIIEVPETVGASQQYLMQYGWPISSKPTILDSSYDEDTIIAKAIDKSAAYPSGSQPERNMATKFNLTRADLGLVKFWTIVTGQQTPTHLGEVSDLLDDFADDDIFEKAVTEIGTSNMQFVREFLGGLPPQMKRQALWRVAMTKPPLPQRNGEFGGADARTVLLIKMYLIANPSTIKPNKIKNVAPDKLLGSIADNPDKFLTVVNRIMKSAGFSQAMVLILGELQRVRMVRSYLRKYGDSYIDAQYF